MAENNDSTPSQNQSQQDSHNQNPNIDILSDITSINLASIEDLDPADDILNSSDETDMTTKSLESLTTKEAEAAKEELMEQVGIPDKISVLSSN